MKKLTTIILISLSLLMCTASLAAIRHKILLIVTRDCPYCAEAESILNKHGYKYRTTMGGGPVPRLYVDGKYKGTGVDAVQSWIRSER